MALTDAQIRSLKPADKPARFFDSGGLYLEVSPAGGKLWRFKYRFNGKHKTYSIGKYPLTSLSEARDELQKAKKLLEKGIDPSASKRQSKFEQSKTFETVSREWWHAKRGKWSSGHASLVWSRLEKNVLPWLKSRPITEFTTRELLEVLRKVEGRGAIETARRIGQVLNQIFIYSVASGYCENNPASSLNQAVKERKVKNFAAITEPKQIKELLKAIDGFTGSFVVLSALKLAPFVFVRPGELRKAEWKEIDFDQSGWTIPAEKMKMRRPHIVPLSRQAIEILKALEPLTGSGRYVFPSIRTAARPMSENTINVALRRLGYSKDEMTGHGFRTMASTRLHEMGWKSEIIEMQLAHADTNKIRGTYNKAEYLDSRIEMMQAWSDYLDCLKNEETKDKVIPLRRSGK